MERENILWLYWWNGNLNDSEPDRREGWCIIRDENPPNRNYRNAFEWNMLRGLWIFFIVNFHRGNVLIIIHAYCVSFFLHAFFCHQQNPRTYLLLSLDLKIIFMEIEQKMSVVHLIKGYAWYCIIILWKELSRIFYFYFFLMSEWKSFFLSLDRHFH